MPRLPRTFATPVIYINDLPDQIKSKCKMFADDSLLHRKIRSPTDSQELQDDLDEVLEWCTKWYMKLNADKCEHMTVSSRHHPTQNEYKLFDRCLANVQTYKYLGLHIS